jgi:hypothetical protein
MKKRRMTKNYNCKTMESTEASLSLLASVLMLTMLEIMVLSLGYVVASSKS